MLKNEPSLISVHQMVVKVSFPSEKFAHDGRFLVYVINLLDNVYLAYCVSQFQALPLSPANFKERSYPNPQANFCIKS